MIEKKSFLLICLTLVLSVVAEDTTTTAERQPQLSHHAALSPNYHINWDFLDSTNSTILIELVVNTTQGWIGFGIGEPTSGSMPGSDTVTITLDNGKPTATDRYTFDFVMPSEDSCQDWKLESYQKTSTQTIARVSRKLDTQDAQDRPIVSGPNRIVWSYGQSPTFGYHGGNRGSTVVTFFGQEPTPSGNTTGVNTAEFTWDYVLAPKRTTYMCKAFQLPNVTDAHIIQIDPIITLQPEAPNFVHHMIVHVCEPTNNESYYYKYQTAGECISPLGDPKSGCTSLLYAWAGTQGPEILPPQVGFRMGTNQLAAARYIVTETHYDNPKLISNLRDKSGVRIHYTPELRQHDAAVMTLGDVLISFPPIPPQRDAVPYETSCPSECTAKWDHDIHVFSDFLHMHTAGKSIFSTITSQNGSNVQELNRVDFYAFDFQQATLLNKQIKRGDRINTHCIYKTIGRVNSTVFGLQSFEEMCLEFIGYYPALVTPSGRPYSLCGFADIYRNGSTNFTWCGSYDPSTSLVMSSNPNVSDPSSFSNIKFGIPPTTCSSTPTTSTSTSTSTPSPTPTSTSPHNPPIPSPKDPNRTMKILLSVFGVILFIVLVWLGVVLVRTKSFWRSKRGNQHNIRRFTMDAEEREHQQVQLEE